MPSDTDHPRVPTAIAAQLRSLIHRGAVAAGERFATERDLAEQFSVSRVTLREALRQLELEGYIEIRRGNRGGAFVTELAEPVAAWTRQMAADPSLVDEIFDYRIGIESATARFAASRRSASDLVRMSGTIGQMRQSADTAGYRQADSEFHEAIADAARSPRLAPAVRRLRGEMFTPFDLLGSMPPAQEDADQHAAILDAITTGDGDLASSVMCAHIERTRVAMHAIVSVP